MSNTTLPVSIRARIVQIERDHADVDFATVNHFWKHEGLKYKDALHAEELERELDRLDALAAAVGLSEEEREERNRVSAELDRFVSAAKCHADRMRSQKQEKQQSERTEAPPIEARRTSNVVTVCVDTEDGPSMTGPLPSRRAAALPCGS